MDRPDPDVGCAATNISPSVVINAADIGCFVRSIFRYADDGFVSLRAFHEHDQSKRPARINSVSVSDGQEALVEAAIRDASWASSHEDPLVFCPPTATFTGSRTAREQDLMQGLVLSVECDERPEESCSANQ